MPEPRNGPARQRIETSAIATVLALILGGGAGTLTGTAQVDDLKKRMSKVELDAAVAANEDRHTQEALEEVQQGIDDNGEKLEDISEAVTALTNAVELHMRKPNTPTRPPQ
jgi:predicted  nucleic acid-binding Zn-ribbon protein